MTRARRSMLLATLLLVAAPAAARADITGVVTNPTGIPVPGASVTVRDSGGGFADVESTDPDGRYTITSASLSGDPAPYTIEVSKFDQCRSGSEATRRALVGGVEDGTTHNFTLDVIDFCAGSAGSGPPATALVDAATRRILSAPGGLAYVEVLVPTSATNLEVLTADGTVIGTSPASDTIPVTAPAAGYVGPLGLRYLSGGAQFVRDLGVMVAQAIRPPAALPGPIDLGAIVDISGSMGGNDPRYLRRDAVNLLVDLATTGDKLGAVGFDDQFSPIFDLTQITGSPTVAATLKSLARQRIINDGGTNYNAGFDAAFAQLTLTPGVDPNRQKAVIFLTDGGHNSGDYLNGHLRFAFTPSGRPWPVCAIQLGPPTSFQADDVARLKRIANETGGQYFATSTAAGLTSNYFSCFGRSTGEKTLFNRSASYRQGQTRRFAERLGRRLPETTFFVGWGIGTYDLTLRDPRGRTYKPRNARRGSVVFRKGSSYAFYRVRRPRAGRWVLGVRARRLPAGRDRARTTITAPPRR